jgi:hypothetical protein
MSDTTWTQFLGHLIGRVSSDLDFNVRRCGIDCLRRVIWHRFDEFHSYFEGNIFTDLDINELKPVLNYERKKVRLLGDLLLYFSFDDDWEVKSKTAQFICDIITHNRSEVTPQSKTQKRAHFKSRPLTVNEEKVCSILRDMQKDCDPFVSDLAEKAIRSFEIGENACGVKKSLHLNDDLNRIEFGDIEELLNDIELSLTIIHEREILNFSDDEDVNFADCY